MDIHDEDGHVPRMPEINSGHGGKRKGAGRKPSGRVNYMTRLRPDTIKWVKKTASDQATQECDVIEETLDQRRGKKPK